MSLFNGQPVYPELAQFFPLANGRVPLNVTEGGLWYDLNSRAFKAIISGVITTIGATSGSILANQVAFGAGPNTISGSANLTYTAGLFNINGDGTSTNWFSLTNTVAATSGTNQNSPIMAFLGKYWTGAASATDSFTFQNVVGAGANPNTSLTLSHLGSGGAGNGSLTVGLLISSGNITANGLLGSSVVGGGTALILQGTTPASSGANISSGVTQITGEYWTGAASADDSWFIQDSLGSGANPTSTLAITHSGSSGRALVTAPSLAVVAATPTGSAGQISFGNTTATSATAGANGAVPAQVAAYLTFDNAGTKFKIPYFNV